MVMFARDAQPPFKQLSARRSPLAELGVALLLLPALVLAFLPTPAAAYFDYKGTAASVDDNTADQGQTITITGMFYNEGGSGDLAAGVGSRTATYYWSTDNTISTGDTILQSTGASNCTQSYAKIQANETITVSQSCVVPSDATLRATSYVGVCAELTVQEAYKNNNCTPGTAVAVNGDADLGVSSVTVDDATLEVGQNFTIAAMVSNSGSTAAPVTTLRYYWSLDATISATDTELCTRSVPVIAAGASSVLSQTCAAPTLAVNVAVSGTNYVGACADQVDNASTSDNCSDGVAVSIDNFDWIVVAGSVSIDDSTVRPGQSIALGATVRNVGGLSAGATTLRFYWSTDSSIETTDTQLCAVAVPSLDTDSSSALSATTCAVPAAATAGDYHVGACVDTQSEEQHSGDSDNCSAGVAVGIDNFDWTVAGSVSIDETSVEPGQSIALGATVRNVGGVAAGATTLRFYWSTDSSIETTDTQLCEVAVPSLDSDSGATLSAACAVPAAAEDGDYHVGACVDTQDGEESVANNCSAGIPVAVSATSLDVDENASVDSVDATLVLRVLLLPGSIRESLLAGDASVAGLVVAGFPALAANEAAIVGLAVELGAQGAGSDMDVDQNASVDSVDATLVLRVLLLPGSIRESLLAGDASVAGLAVAGFPALAANEVAIVNRVLGLIGN